MQLKGHLILTAVEIANWTALYVATATCCAIACALSIPITLYSAVQGAERLPFRNRRDVVFALPKLWWRWQKLYLTSTPVVLAIVGSFAYSLRWS